jgi:hypothetical protein
MDAYQPGRAGSGIGEPVWHPGRANDDVARAAIENLIPDGDPDRALEDDKGLVIGMVVQPGSLTGLVMHQEERHRARAMPAALEGAGNLIARQIIGVSRGTSITVPEGHSMGLPVWVRPSKPADTADCRP